MSTSCVFCTAVFASIVATHASHGVAARDGVGDPRRFQRRRRRPLESIPHPFHGPAITILSGVL